ncbi:PD-(D/E)XK nuclease family protein [Salmonirosea aquatica]|uniref:PD-(D/E)XK endonuclease-like domain-containing protein n=1 Tax=Salmonirosea aquatica TaxID=2654236 RepID=A0A7C9FAT4_9BACT|nr:hypothetical protein [Cytophagaceae bacterium SJW1-29]
MSSTWSLSAITAFRVCQRKYYFGHVLAKNHPSSPMIAKQAYWLKKAVNLEMWAGHVVDRIMTDKIVPAYKDGLDPDIQLTEAHALDLLNRQWHFSKDGSYRGTTESGSGDAYRVLDVHENGSPFEKKDLEEVVRKVRESIRNVGQMKLADGSSLVDLLKEANWVSTDLNNRWTSIGDTSVGPQIDLMFWCRSSLHVIDWKVSEGKNSDYSRQLGVIGMVVYRARTKVYREKAEAGEDTWMYDLEKRKIVLHEVNLLSGYAREHVFDKSTYGSHVDYVSKTSRDMEFFQKGRSWQDIPLNEYAFTESDYACQSCSFRHLCNYLIENSHESFNPANYREFIRAAQLI